MRFAASVFAPLRHRTIALLWSGQLSSAIGDEVHRVAVAALGASLLGSGAGYLAAVYAGAAFASSLLGGSLAERFSRRRLMILADLGRALAVAVIPLGALLGAPLPWLLVPVIATVAALTALFEPALRASLAELAPHPQLLLATTGLMETTARFARLVGPSLVAVLSASLPLIHFFTLDAATFLLSAASIGLLARAWPATRAPAKATKPSSTLAVWRDEVRDHRLVRWLILTSSIAGATWYLVLPTGMALLMKEREADAVGALGALVGAYGLGNLLSNLVLGSLELRQPERLVFFGRLVCGLGFVGLSQAPSLPWAMASAAVAATGGPATDLGFLTVLQRHYAPDAVARVFRLTGAVAWLGILILFVLSPWLFERLGVGPVVAGAGLVLAACGVAGYATFPDPKGQTTAVS